MSRAAAIVLDLTYSGCGVARTLLGHSTALIAIQGNLDVPKPRTRLAEVLNLVDQAVPLTALLGLGRAATEAPVLSRSPDAEVSSLSRNRDTLTPNRRTYVTEVRFNQSHFEH